MKKYYPVRNIENLRHMLRTSADLFGEKAAFLVKREGEYRPISFDKFRRDVEGLGCALWNMGLEGKRIIVIGENCYEWALAYMSVICGLGVVVPVDKEIPSEEIVNISLISEVDAVIYSLAYEDKIAALDERIVRIPFDDLGEMAERGVKKINSGDHAYLDAIIDPDVMSALLFTSGTTGVSKGVMLSHRNICFNLMEMCQMTYIGPEDVFLSVLPLHHAYECTCGFLCQIYRGSTIAYCEGLRYVTKNLKEAGATKMLCVPLLLETMYNKIWQNVRKKGMEKKLKSAIKFNNILKKTGVDLSRKLFAEIHHSLGGKLNMLIVGGAAVDPKVLSGLRDLGIHAIQGYGLTECAPLAALNRDVHYKDDAAGLATPNTKLEIYDKQEDGTGEIRFRGDNIMLGYYKQPKLTAEIIVGGWLYTGDLGYIDKKGFLHITGRKKNVIVTANGKNIFPEELETYINRSPYVKESVVCGIMNSSKKDYDLIAVVVPEVERFEEDFGDEVTPQLIKEKIEQVISDVNKLVQSYKNIDYTIIRNEEFEKNTSRKIKRAGVIDSIMPEYQGIVKKTSIRK